MTDYTKTTDFAAKDALSSGNSAKIVNGTEINTEFANIATAVATKSNVSSPTFTGTLTAATLSITGNTTLGNAASDTITFTGDVSSHILPSADATYNLGASGSEWNDLYVDGTAYVDAINFNGTGITSTAAELNILDGVTATAAELNILDGVTSTTAELNILDGVTSTAAELNILDGVTSTAAELNILDGVTSTFTELNLLDGVTATTAELNILDGVTSTFTELNLLDGVTSTTAELNILDGVTSTAAELNILDGVTSTAAELNILDGVTSTAAELNLVDGAGTLKEVGKETIYIPAAGMYPNTTNGCADLAQVELTNGPELKCLDFAAGADDFAQFTVAFPKSWNEGTVTFQAFWTVTGTNTGTVAWGLSGGSMANDASINTAFGTAVVATALAHSGTSNDMMVSAESGAVTIANAAVNTLTYFEIFRDVSADNQSGDARLLGIKVFFTTDAANDA